VHGLSTEGGFPFLVFFPLARWTALAYPHLSTKIVYAGQLSNKKNERRGLDSPKTSLCLYQINGSWNPSSVEKLKRK